MAFGNRLINTDSGGATGGVIGANLNALDFGFPNTWRYGIDWDGTYMYNKDRVNRRIGIGYWEAEASVSIEPLTQPVSGTHPAIAAVDDGTFLTFEYGGMSRYDASWTRIAGYGVSGWDITALPNGFATTSYYSNAINIYDYNGTLLNSFSADAGAGSGYENGLCWDGGGLWVSTGTEATTNGVIYKYTLDGTLTGDIITPWANRKWEFCGFRNDQFYALHDYGTPGRYDAILP